MLASLLGCCRLRSLSPSLFTLSHPLSFTLTLSLCFADPYCILSHGGSKVTTEIKFKTINPKRNEVCGFWIPYDSTDEKLSILVRT